MNTTPQGSRAADLGLGRLGVWSTSIRFAPEGEGVAAAGELARMGFAACWVPGGVDSGVLDSVDQLLTEAPKITFGTGILNIWKHEPTAVAAWWRAQSPERQARTLLGLGSSHGPLIGEAYQRPLTKMASFLDALEEAEMSLERTCLAALGPKMLELAGQRTAGSCPYLTTPHHTEVARGILGRGPLLAPEQGVVLEADAATARNIAREHLRAYAALPNYTNNWLRDGFTREDIADLSDRLIDSLIAWGDLAAIEARVNEHIEAGADHVCLQVIGQEGFARAISADLSDWRKLAKLL